jgi:hypothetical protein
MRSSRFRLDVRSLAAFRIAAGLLLAADALLRCRDFGLMFTPSGMFPHQALRAFHGSTACWSLNFLIDAAWWDAAVLALEGVSGLVLAAGFQTRLATLVAWVALVSVIRRTAPATNAGDLWLACLLLWGTFLPLGARASLDARRVPGRPSPSPTRIASLAFTLQVLVVYLAAGLAKCNEHWFTGTAVRDALSVHDHGTALGAWVVGLPGVATLAGVLVVALELAGPFLFLVAPQPRIRAAVVFAFMAFHASVAAFMTVGLFAPIGLVAWLALIPGSAWDRLRTVSPGPLPAACDNDAVDAMPTNGSWVSLAAQGICGGLLMLGIIDATSQLLPHKPPLPTTLRTAMNLACLRQEWEMFGTVLHQEQWTYARGVLVDGSEVDLLRGGQPLQRERPAGGFNSLPHHRWHKLLWVLPKPSLRVFSPSIARALAEDWNARHGPQQHLRKLEICFARLTALTATDAEPGVLHELVVATWPPRDSKGTGNLDRWLEEHDSPEPKSSGVR